MSKDKNTTFTQEMYSVLYKQSKAEMVEDSKEQNKKFEDLMKQVLTPDSSALNIEEKESDTEKVDNDYSEYAELEGRIVETVEYCLPHVEQMWAAQVIGTLLNCDFRDAKAVATSYLSEFE